jgi:hypothetical protein
MAYTAEQRTTIARELARSGGNVAAALERLRNEYETFRAIGETTVRNLMKKDGFAELVASEGQKLAVAREEGIAEAERARARREAEGTILARMQHDEAILDSLRQRVEDEVKKSDFDINQAVKLYAEMRRIHDRRNSELIPAVAETREATALVESVLEAAIEMFGQARGKELISAIKARYAAKQAAFAQTQETAA